VTTGGTIQFVEQRSILGATLPVTQFQQTLAAGTYIFGPFGPSVFNDPNNLLQMLGTFFGGASNNIGAYILPGFAT
jgi:hypothetical protein